MSIINKQTSREPHIMALIRPLVLACLCFNINFTARHIPGRINTLADKLSSTGTMGRSQPAGNSLQYLPSGLVSRLLEASSTRAHYQRALGKLVTFFQSLGMYPSLPIPVAMILLFEAHLHAGGAAPATIVSNVSAIAYFHKINGLPDPTSNFIVVKLLAGARNLGSVPDVRLPVTLPILSRLVQALPSIVASTYRRIMLRAMMVIAFRAYLPVGEMVPR